MDPRGGLTELSGLVEGALDQLARHAGAEFEHLARARRHTDEDLPKRANAVAEVELPDESTLCLMGSWGRREVVTGSDDDWLLIGEAEGGAPALVRQLRERLGDPGPERVFGTYAAKRTLVTQIGLDRDQNSNLTRRILLLLESLPLRNARYHGLVREALLDRYVDRSVRDYRVPRFLLNDIVRYWRTICVDFAGKEQDRGGAGWGLRNAKLRTSRKLLFASGLFPTLLCGRLPRAEMKPFLARQLAAPATDRVASAFLAAGEIDVGARALGAYDRFVGMLSDPTVRTHLKQVTRDDARTSPTFREVRRLGDRLQEALVALLFETSLFARAAREYAVF